MLKPSKIVNLAAERFQEILRDIPFIKQIDVRREPSRSDGIPDLVVHVTVPNHPHTFVCEVKTNGEPRHIRNAAAQLHYFLGSEQPDVSRVIIAPYLSQAARQICLEQQVGYLDFEGNCRLEFNSVFIDRVVSTKPRVERRGFRSIFAPKSAQVLRTMLRDPSRRWHSAELAKAACVSLGHASNVRSALINQEWGKADKRGVYLTRPDELLDVWRDNYKPPVAHRLAFYTTLHGAELQKATRETLEATQTRGEAILASFSAAQWLAPYGRVPTQYFYADSNVVEIIRDRLRLTSPAKGENVIVLEPDNPGVLLDAVEPAPGIRTTSAIQTYLDLWVAGDRGREAAEHLRAEKLRWPQNHNPQPTTTIEQPKRSSRSSSRSAKSSAASKASSP